MKAMRGKAWAEGMRFLTVGGWIKMETYPTERHDILYMVVTFYRLFLL